MIPVVMQAVRVPRLGGRARTRPDAMMGEEAYSSRANRSLLRGRGIKAAIPDPTGFWSRSGLSNAAGLIIEPTFDGSRSGRPPPGPFRLICTR